MSTIKDAIRAAKLPERVVPVCLNLDLQAEFEAAERELQELLDRPRDSLAAGGPPKDLSQRVRDLEAEMREHTHDFRLRALPRPGWLALVADHPPRQTEDGAVDQRDQYVGVNAETFFTALVRASVVAPELDEEDWRLLLDEKLTDRQFDQLSDAAWSLNRRDVDVPFSRAASRHLPVSVPE
ncbi:hypothetical protein ACFP2T_16495 [Plantactinospora solaniradicis]|uniref:Uncharacterized protein n=1 Tax=Plantactinospora solaniradicis TaxID=1723736 RepID=A0ABW1K9I3_9ACTN